MNFKYILISLQGLIAVSCQTNESAQKDLVHPNIIIVLADDLGYGDVGVFNPQSKIPTPALDRIARAGMIFTDTQTSSSVCTPTRYSLLTGHWIG